MIAMKGDIQEDRSGEAGRQPLAVVVMGVAGCGKSVVGTALAESMGLRYIEGDELHPPENVARMRRGEPLTDELREGWLDAVGAAIQASLEQGKAAIAACSALKLRYRDRLRAKAPTLVFVYLAISPETARSRVGGRSGHFMPASLVDSQFATLEPPDAEEWAFTISGEKPIADVVDEARVLLEQVRSRAAE